MENTSESAGSAASSSLQPPIVAADARTSRADSVIAIAIGLAATLFAAYARHISTARPGVVTHLGFYGGFDQGSYLRTARILAHWRLPTRHTDYEYGLGYPVVAVPFIWLRVHSDPFAVPDAIAFGLSVSLTYILGLRLPTQGLHIRREVLGIGAALVVAASSPLLTVASSPWNSNIVVPLGLVILVIATSTRELSRMRCVVLGLAIGWILSARYLDALFLGVPAVALAIRSQPPLRRRLLAFGGGAFILVLTIVLLSQQYTFGNFLATPYHFHHRTSGSRVSNDQSLGEYRLSSIPTHFLGTFITGSLNGVRQTGEPVLRQFPLLVLAPLGAWRLLRTATAQRAVWSSVIGGSVVGSLFYLSFVAGGAGDLAFTNIRYWAPWYPLWALCAVLGLASIVAWIANVATRGSESRS